MAGRRAGRGKITPLAHAPGHQAQSPGLALGSNGSSTTASCAQESLFDFEYNQAFSLECWVYLNGPGSQQMFISKRLASSPYTGYEFWVSAAGVINFELYNNSTYYIRMQTGAIFTAFTTWKHLVVTYNGSGLGSGVLIYFNAASQSLSTWLDNLASHTILNNITLNFASRLVVGTYLNGRLDEVRVYNKVLTPSEVTAHYNAGAGAFGVPETNLIGGWHFDEGNGPTANDYSGNAAHAALTNYTWATGVVTAATAVDPLITAAPGSSAIADSAAEGVSSLFSRSDHKHGREAAAAPGSSAIADTPAAGSAATVARSDHKHGREAAGTPVTQNYNDTPAAGSAATVARSDHRHGMPSSGTPSGIWQVIAETTLAAAATSYTFSGLTGATDLEYHLISRIITNYAGALSIDVRLNNDGGANYGYQLFYAAGTGYAASAAVNDTGIYIGGGNAVNQLSFGDTLIWAKSGYVRTARVFNSDMGTAETVGELDIWQYQWNNTTDEITSLVVVASQANGLGIGTHLELWARR